MFKKITMNGYAKPFWWTLGIVVILIASIWAMQNGKVESIEARTARLEDRQANMQTNIALMCQKLNIVGCRE